MFLSTWKAQQNAAKHYGCSECPICNSRSYDLSEDDFCIRHEKDHLLGIMGRTHDSRHDEAKSDLAALMQFCEEEGCLCA